MLESNNSLNGKQKQETERQTSFSLGSEIQKISQEQKNYVILAPLSGRLVSTFRIQKGNFLVQGQTIGEISLTVSSCRM